MSDTPPPPAAPREINLNYETPQRHGNAPMLVRLAGIFGLVTAAIDLVYGVGMIVMACFMYYMVTTVAAGGGGAFVVGPGAGAPVAPAVAGAPPATGTAPAPPGPEVAPPAAGVPAPGPGLVGAAGAPPAAPLPPAAPAPLPPFMKFLFLGMYGGPGILSLLMVTPKAIGATKLLRLRKRAWGWGLVAGIAGCVEFWMIVGCCPLLIITMGAGIYTVVILCLPHVRAYVLAQQAAHSAGRVSA